MEFINISHSSKLEWEKEPRECEGGGRERKERKCIGVYRNEEEEEGRIKEGDVRVGK